VCPRALSLGLLLACAAPRATPAPEPAPSVTAPVPLTEDEFKALHELSPDRAPAPRGQTIDLAGTRAYLSLPGGVALGGIVVVHEWWGLNDHIRHWADRLGAEGYAALAVDLYGGKTAADADLAMELMKSVDRAAAVRTLLAAHRFLASDARARASRRAVIGWCFGGGMALELALAAPDLDAAVIYYGPLVTDAARLRNVRARLLGVFGTRDEAVPPESVAAFERAASEAGLPLEVHRYDAPHAFANPSGPRYDAAAAEDAWNRVRSFLRAKLGGCEVIPGPSQAKRGGSGCEERGGRIP